MAESVRNYPKLANEILDLVGGEANVRAASRCTSWYRVSGSGDIRIAEHQPAQEPTEIERSLAMSHITRTVRIGSTHGLHARPAKLFAQAAKDSGLPVTIAKGAASPVNAASILGVIALGAEKDDYVTLAAEGEGAEDLLDVLSELLSTDHDAEA